MTDNQMRAVLATAFALFLLVAIVAQGNPLATWLALLAGLTGCFSQFAGQATRHGIRRAADAAALVGFAVTLAAIFVLMP